MLQTQKIKTATTPAATEGGTSEAEDKSTETLPSADGGMLPLNARASADVNWSGSVSSAKWWCHRGVLTCLSPKFSCSSKLLMHKLAKPPRAWAKTKGHIHWMWVQLRMMMDQPQPCWQAEPNIYIKPNVCHQHINNNISLNMQARLQQQWLQQQYLAAIAPKQWLWQRQQGLKIRCVSSYRYVFFSSLMCWAMYRGPKGTTLARGSQHTCRDSGGNPPEPLRCVSCSTDCHLQTDSAYGIGMGTMMTQGAHEVWQWQEELPPPRLDQGGNSNKSSS